MVAAGGAKAAKKKPATPGEMPVWFVYLIECADKTIYAGVTTDVNRRFGEHAGAGARAARYLRGRGPLALVFSAPVGSRSRALRCEYKVKQLTHKQKKQLILTPALLTHLLTSLDTSK